MSLASRINRKNAGRLILGVYGGCFIIYAVYDGILGMIEGEKIGKQCARMLEALEANGPTIVEEFETRSLQSGFMLSSVLMKMVAGIIKGIFHGLFLPFRQLQALQGGQ